MLDIVFYGRAESRWWKDLLVLLVRDLETSPYGLQCEGFIDRVSGWRYP